MKEIDTGATTTFGHETDLLHNLTPHNIRIFPTDCPDSIDPQTGPRPIHVIFPSRTYPTARIGEIPLGTHYLHGLPVEYVEYTAHGGLVNPLPEVVDGVYFIVSLVAAMQQTYVYNRADLLVPYREVRNTSGTVIGCRQLARPV